MLSLKTTPTASRMQLQCTIRGGRNFNSISSALLFFILFFLSTDRCLRTVQRPLWEGGVYGTLLSCLTGKTCVSGLREVRRVQK